MCDSKKGFIPSFVLGFFFAISRLATGMHGHWTIA